HRSQLAERRTQEQRPELAAETCRTDLRPQPMADEASGGFRDLERDVAGEPIRHDDVEIPGEQVAALGVPGIEEVLALVLAQQAMDRTPQLCPLTVIAAVAQHGDARPYPAVLPSGVHRPENGELHEVQRPNVDVRAHVEERDEV